MSNNNPLFILLVGATILSLILVTGSIYAFAQEEEEDKDDKDEKDEKDEEKDKEESKDEDEDEEKEESKDEDENSNNDTAATQIIQDQLTPPPINNDTTATIVNTTTTFQESEPIITMTPPPLPSPTEEEGEFNATCQCKTTSSKKPKPPSNDPPTNDEQTILPITSANIKDSRSFGQVIDPAYTSFYTVPNLLDTKIDDVSFWSQAGQSSFYIHLDDTLDNYQVCSAELNGIHNPKNTPYLLDVGVSQNYSGVIDQTKEKIQFDKCVKNMDEIYMIFDNEAGNYISIAEIKLFGSKLTGAAQTTIPPTLQPPLIPNEEETENATKINIENSNAEIDIKNSTVTFKFDPMTATFVQQGGGQ